MDNLMQAFVKIFGIAETHMKRHSLVFESIDKPIALLAIILSIILMIFMRASLTFLLVSILILFCCSLWLFLRSDARLHERTTTWSDQVNNLISILFFLLLSLSIIILYLRSEQYSRPLAYLIIISVQAGLIAVQIFFCPTKRQRLVLVQILILGLSLAWSQLFIIPGQLGIDPWYHKAFTDSIIVSGGVPPGGSYSLLPLFHIEAAITSLILNLEYKLAIIASNSLMQIICNTLFVYILAKWVFNNVRLALFSSLALVIATYHISMSVYSIPNSYSAIFIPICLFLLLIVKKKQPIQSLVVLFVVLCAIIFSHSITAMAAIMIIFSVWIGTKLWHATHNNGHDETNLEVGPSLTIPLLFSSATFAWWAYVSGHVTTLSTFFVGGFGTDIFDNSPDYIVSNVQLSLWATLFQLLGVYLFFSLALLGSLYILSKNGSGRGFLICLAGLTPLITGFLSTILNIGIIEQRWWYIAQIFLSVPVAVGAFTITSKMRPNKVKPLFIFGSMIVLTLLCIIVSPANQDNNDLVTNGRYSLTESEQQATRTIANVWDGRIGGDGYYSLTYMKWNGYSYLSINDNLYSGNFSSVSSSLILIREYIEEGTIKFYSTSYRIEYNIEEALFSEGFIRIYHSPGAAGYITQ